MSKTAQTPIIRPAARFLRQAMLKAYAVGALGVPYRLIRDLYLRPLDGSWIAFRRGTSDEEVLAHSFDKDIFLPGVPEYRPGEGDVILDVGAHLGDFALLMASKVGNGKVYAIEPCGTTFAVLEANVALNRSRPIVALQLALADHDGTCTLYHAPPGESWGDSTTHNYACTSEDVPCRSLSSFLAEQGITHVDFAKFNCEGGEFAILLGADMATLRRMRMLLVLYHCDLAKGASEGALIDHLHAAGFRTTIRNRTEDRGWIIAQQKTD